MATVTTESPNKSLAMVPSTSSLLLTTDTTQALVPSRKKENFNEVDRGAPGDASLMAMVKREPEEVKRARQKSSFYGEVFAYREPTTPKDRVARESPITAEIKTNVIINDEYTFLTDLTTHLSARYSRPTSSILISLSHSSCLILGNSFDPAYLLTITAIPAHIQPTVNKRNAGLLQVFFAENLGVPAHRGIVKFVPIPEDNLASGGITVADRWEKACKKVDSAKPGEKGELDKERERDRRRKTIGGPKPSTPIIESPKDAKAEEEDHVGLLGRARSRSRTSEKRRSRKSSLAAGIGGTAIAENEKVPPMPPMPTGKSSLDIQAEKAQKMGKRRSLISLFSRS